MEHLSDALLGALLHNYPNLALLTIAASTNITPDCLEFLLPLEHLRLLSILDCGVRFTAVAEQFLESLTKQRKGMVIVDIT